MRLTNGLQRSGVCKAHLLCGLAKINIGLSSRKLSCLIGLHQVTTGSAKTSLARTNGDLDYDNWVLFFTGHGASGGGSDLDQGDTRRHFKMKDFSTIFQDDWRIRRGLTINR